jgi:hydrogenase assembly chaperone HypC/HupF
MCIGFPMRVIEGDGVAAVCEGRGPSPGLDPGSGRGPSTGSGRGARERIDMLIVGAQPPGTWVLAFHGAARRVLTETEALQTLDALDALGIALQEHDGGREAVDALFADLVDREPQLPEHLRTDR